MVWMILGLPATAVIAGFTTYFIAAHEPDSLVRGGYQKEGFAVTVPLDEASKAAYALGISAKIEVKGQELHLHLIGGPQQRPEQLILNIIHPTQAKSDMPVRLVYSHDLTYISPVPDVGTGKRDLALEPENKEWRITGHWTAPFTGTVDLAVTQTESSTRPTRGKQ